MSEEKMFTETEMQEMKAQIERQTAISVAGGTVLTKCLAYVSEEVKLGRATKLELDVLIMVYRQFTTPVQPEKPPDKTEGQDNKEKTVQE